MGPMKLDGLFAFLIAIGVIAGTFITLLIGWVWPYFIDFIRYLVN